MKAYSGTEARFTLELVYSLVLFSCAVLWHKVWLPLSPETKKGNVMFEIVVTLGLAAFAIWLLLDSAVEYIRDGQEDTLATEP